MSSARWLQLRSKPTADRLLEEQEFAFRYRAKVPVPDATPLARPSISNQGRSALSDEPPRVKLPPWIRLWATHAAGV